MARGSTQELARIVRRDVHTIEDVVQRLEAVRDHATDTALRGEADGIACFTRLYTVITENVGKTASSAGFRDTDFLIRLDVEFARRYFDAIRAYARDTDATPRCWKVLFDRRSDPDIGPVHFAAAGVNAHVNLDLAAALLRTWKDFPPDREGVRYADYNRINDIFAAEMDGLREMFGALLADVEDGWIDRLANRMSDLLVRLTRDWAWDAAMDVWEAKDRAAAWRVREPRLDATAELIGIGLLEAPFLPV